MKIKHIGSLFFLTLLLFTSSSIWAQTSHSSKTEKLFLNAHINADYLNVEDADPVGGSGFGIKAGYGFSPLFTLYIGIDGARMNASDFPGDDNDEAEQFDLGFAELGAQFNFRSGKSAAIPYANIALTGQGVLFDFANNNDVTFSGGGLTAGGGIKYFVSKTLALDLGLSFTFGNFGEVEYRDQTFDIDQNSFSSRLDFGVSWFPFNK